MKLKPVAFFVISLALVSIGPLLMYDSGFLLHPTGYVFCGAECDYYKYVYPIKRAEYWIGLFTSITSLLPLGIGTFMRYKSRSTSHQPK